MALRHQDVAVLQQGLQSLQTGILAGRDRKQNTLDRERREALDRELLALRKSEAEENTKDRRSAAENRALDLADARENRRKSLSVQEQRAKDAAAHENRMLESQKEQSGWQKKLFESREFNNGIEQLNNAFKELSGAVKSGAMSPDDANRAAKDIYDQITQGTNEMLKASPFVAIMKGGKLFSSQPATSAEKIQYSEDPVSGKRQAIYNGQLRDSGENPDTVARTEAQVQSNKAAKADADARAKDIAELEALKAGGAKWVKKVGGKWVDVGGGWTTTGEVSPDKALGSLKPQQPAQQPQAPVPDAAAQPQKQTGAMHGAARPQTVQEFNRLPKGTKYVHPKDGKLYIKN